ncbi:MAG: RagB/SusD family nutrient uptake outer membrane protein [Rikenellaceae bacterium]
MKNLGKIFIILLASSFSSCQDFLTEEPASFNSPDYAFTTEESAYQLLTGVYDALSAREYAGTDCQYGVTDIMRTIPTNTYGGVGDFTLQGDNAFAVVPCWESYYNAVNVANTAIDRIPLIDMDEEVRTRYVAEAIFLRTLVYFNLVRFWGDIPFPRSETTSVVDVYDVVQTPAREVMLQLIDDVEGIVDNLPSRADAELGHATSAAAKALLAHLYITIASTDKRDGISDGKTYYQECVNYSYDILYNYPEYVLCDYYPDAFVKSNKNHAEMIFDIGFMSGGVDDNVYGGVLGLIMGLSGTASVGGAWTNLRATEYYHTIFEDTDLVRSEWNSPHYSVAATGALTNLTLAEENTHPWKMAKFRRWPDAINDANFNMYSWDCHWPVYRLAEIYLFYAEALNEVNQGPNDEVIWALNKLRERARWSNTGNLYDDITPRVLTYNADRMPDLTSAEIYDYDSTFDYIFYERAREMGGECRRRFDLVRWGLFVEKILELDTLIPNGRTRVEYSWTSIAANVKEYHTLWPIPTSEMKMNPNLVQNEGYN